MKATLAKSKEPTEFQFEADDMKNPLEDGPVIHPPVPVDLIATKRVCFFKMEADFISDDLDDRKNNQQSA
jgi:hypothetical protein